MTYLELLLRIKAKTQPPMVFFNDDIYKWRDFNYKNDADEYIAEHIDETAMVTHNCIKAVRIVEDDEIEDPEPKTLGDIIAEKCF